MQLDIISFDDLTSGHAASISLLKTALLHKGIVGIRDIPTFEHKCRTYIDTSRRFASLDQLEKQKYTTNRDLGQTEGYELGAEWFKTNKGTWQIDDKKASFYAYVPDHVKNIWPLEVDLKTPYLALGELIFNTGKHILNIIGLNDEIGLNHNQLVGYGRLLHYHKENNLTNDNPNWCGAHFDHGLFTGLIPAYYFQNGVEVDEPEEAGLYVIPNSHSQFEKVHSTDKNVLMFQVGEFGQIISHDRIRATKHMVRKASGEIERFTFALFYSADDNTRVMSHSELTQDQRYYGHQSADGSITYGKWHKASFERYRAIVNESEKN